MKTACAVIALAIGNDAVAVTGGSESDPEGEVRPWMMMNSVVRTVQWISVCICILANCDRGHDWQAPPGPRGGHDGGLRKGASREAEQDKRDPTISKSNPFGSCLGRSSSSFQSSLFFFPPGVSLA